jgi:hypothetical protein
LAGSFAGKPAADTRTDFTDERRQAESENGKRETDPYREHGSARHEPRRPGQAFRGSKNIEQDPQHGKPTDYSDPDSDPGALAACSVAQVAGEKSTKQHRSK